MQLTFGVMLLPGLICIVFFDLEVLVQRKNVDSSTVVLVLVCALVSFLYSIKWVRHFNKIDWRNGAYYPRFGIKDQLLYFWVNVFLLLACVFFRGVDNLPLKAMIFDNAFEAARVKYDYMNGLLPRAPTLLAEVAKFSILFSGLLSAYTVQPFRKGIGKSQILLVGSLVLAICFLALDGHKAPGIVFSGLIATILFNRNVIGIKSSLVFFTFLLFVMFTIFISSIQLGERDPSWTFIERALFGQTAGAILIIDKFKPDFDLVFHGMLGAGTFFDDLPNHAHVQIMEVVYGPSSTNVNMNSFYIGEAFSWGGVWGVIFSMFFIFIFGSVSLSVMRWLCFGNQSVRCSLLILYFFSFFPILQGFNSILYGRNLFFFLLGWAFVLFVYRLLKLHPRRVSV